MKSITRTKFVIDISIDSFGSYWESELKKIEQRLHEAMTLEGITKEGWKKYRISREDIDFEE
jgi:hypothetical protein